MKNPAIDCRMMALALTLAERGRGYVTPNPVVGCVLTIRDSIVGEGFHAYCGGPHAEVEAISAARANGNDLRGATAYVSLEPCNHYGRTPPCTEALIEAGIKRVVIAVRDPNPVASGGIERLRQAGIEVDCGMLAASAIEANLAFFKFQRTGMPFVAAKWAMTLDGRMATASRDSKWITSAQARKKAHILRAQHDAVLVGIGTAIVDSPKLNVRLDRGADGWNGFQPWRVVLDPEGKTPLDGPLWLPDAQGNPASAEHLKLIVAIRDSISLDKVKRLLDAGAKLIQVSGTRTGQLDLIELLEALGRFNLHALFVEGGSRTLAQFLDAQRIDRCYAFIGPKLLGGKNSLAPFAGLDRTSISAAIPSRITQVEQLGPDLCITAQVGDWSWLG